MDDVIIFKAPHHLHDGITLTDIGQELVTQAFTLRRRRRKRRRRRRRRRRSEE